jgi:hypothetical protein
VALVIAVLAAARPARASTPAQMLDQARELFREGAFAQAIPSLNYLLYPTPRLSDRDDLVEAHLLLAVCALETGDTATATREVEEVLFLEPGLSLDTGIFSERAVEFFDTIKQELTARAAREAEQRRLAEENERLQRLLDAMVVIETRPYYVNFIPFGAGQFQNGHRGKGVFFAASQAATGGLSAGLWLYLVGTYGLPGTVSAEEAPLVRRLQQIEIGAGALCLGLMAWGIVDSLIYYKPSVRGEPDESLLPPELRRRRPAPTSRRPLVTPTPLARGGGLTLTWEY